VIGGGFMNEDGVLYIDEIRMYKHILFDENRVVRGFLLSGTPEMNPARQDIMLIADNDPMQHSINVGWRLDETEGWIPPEEPPASLMLNDEIAEIECQLRLLKDYEETAEWLGVVPYTEECDAVLPPPVYHKPDIPQAPQCSNLFEAFQSLVVNVPQGIVNMGDKPKVKGKKPMKAITSAPKSIPSKKELLSLLKDKRQRLHKAVKPS
jgi:hypothetical protein